MQKILRISRYESANVVYTTWHTSDCSNKNVYWTHCTFDANDLSVVKPTTELCLVYTNGKISLQLSTFCTLITKCKCCFTVSERCIKSCTMRAEGKKMFSFDCEYKVENIGPCSHLVFQSITHNPARYFFTSRGP